MTQCVMFVCVRFYFSEKLIKIFKKYKQKQKTNSRKEKKCKVVWGKAKNLKGLSNNKN